MTERKANQKKLNTQLFPVKLENEDIISTIRSWNSDWAHVHDYISIRMIQCMIMLLRNHFQS